MSFWYRYVFGIGLMIFSFVNLILVIKNRRIIKTEMPGDTEDSRRIRGLIVYIGFLFISIAIVFDLF
jgi:hypothetical protein